MFRARRTSYKQAGGFQYPFCFDFYQLQQKLHWLPSEVSLQNDVVCWNTELTESERHLLTQVQLFLANADGDVAASYVEKYLPNLPLPECRMMLLAIANMESIHQESYSYTIDTLGMPESSYSAFLEIPEMYEKHLFLTQQRTEKLEDVQKFLLDIAISSCLGEGLQLFSAFAIILSFMRRGLMNGLGQLTSFIARDEMFHCGGMTEVFNTISAENTNLWTAELVGHIQDSARKAVELEDHFIDMAFSMGDVPNLTAADLKQYIRHIANARLSEIQVPPVFDDSHNPIDWIDDMLYCPSVANFFEVRNANYSLDNWTGTHEDSNAFIRSKPLAKQF